MGVLLVLAMAILSVPAMAQGGSGSVDILGKDGGIFETEGSAFRFPEFADTNVDILTVGNDKALAFGSIWRRAPMAVATNDLVIKKNQDSGACECCDISCQDCCIKANLEQITVGNRNAMAFGFAAATNNVKIVTNQQ
ncbi:MAG: hypothetical protein EHM65_11360 [Acidobacteriales bacterium]|nr:MAG: hypothetical protein EHM65_11360 [Terriglobales bacterium]